MREAQTREIDGIPFTVQQLPAMRAAKLSHRLGSVVGPAIAKIAAGAAKDELDLSQLGDAVQILFDRLPEKEFEALIKELLETAQVTINGQTAPLMPAFDAVFTGKISTLFKVLKFSLEVNFADFFDAAAPLIRKAQTFGASRSSSLNTLK